MCRGGQERRFYCVWWLCMVMCVCVCVFVCAVYMYMWVCLCMYVCMPASIPLCIPSLLQAQHLRPYIPQWLSLHQAVRMIRWWPLAETTRPTHPTTHDRHPRSLPTASTVYMVSWWCTPCMGGHTHAHTHTHTRALTNSYKHMHTITFNIDCFS